MNYIKQLTFLRFLAAVLVVIFHYGKGTFPFNMNIIYSFIDRGSIAVSFFFFLSGVVLALNYIGKAEFSNKEFFIKRLARIYPVLILAFVATLILGMIFNDAYPKGGSIILQILSLHAWYPGICLEINYVSWSISVEVFFYLLFPFILKYLNKISDFKAKIIIILFWFFSAVQYYISLKYLNTSDSIVVSQFISCFPLWHLNTFLMGILCAKYIIKKRESNLQNFIKPRILLIAGVVILFAILNTNNYIKLFTNNGLLAPIFFMIIAGLAVDKSLLTKFLGNDTFVLLGNSSYAIYIFQWPVFICLSALFGQSKLDGYYFYIYLLSLILISVAAYLFFEKPMRKLIIEKWIKNRQNKTNIESHNV